MILGAGGFIGSNFIQYLGADTETSILVHKKFPAIDCDKSYSGSLQTFSWNRIKETPRVIYHFARIPGKGRAGRYGAALQSRFANQRLIKWLKTMKSPPLLVYCAGTLAYGNRDDSPADENTPLAPTSFAKQYCMGEQPIVDQLKKEEIPVQIIRPSWVYGNGSWLRNFYLKPMTARQKIPLYGSGDNWMSLIHVTDVCGMIRHISQKGPACRSYNVFTPEPIKQIEFVNLLSRISGYPVEKISLKSFKGADKALRQAFTFSLKTSSLYQSLYKSYTFQYPLLQDGLVRVLEEYQNTL